MTDEILHEVRQEVENSEPESCQTTVTTIHHTGLFRTKSSKTTAFTNKPLPPIPKKVEVVEKKTEIIKTIKPIKAVRRIKNGTLYLRNNLTKALDNSCRSRVDSL